MFYLASSWFCPNELALNSIKSDATVFSPCQQVYFYRDVVLICVAISVIVHADVYNLECRNEQ